MLQTLVAQGEGEVSEGGTVWQSETEVSRQHYNTATRQHSYETNNPGKT